MRNCYKQIFLTTGLFFLSALSCQVFSPEAAPAPPTQTPTTEPTPTPTLPPFNYDPFRRPVEVAGTMPPSPSCKIQSPEVPASGEISIPENGIPQRGLAFQDPDYRTCVVRLTDRGRDLSPQDMSHGLSNETSRVQSFNADNSYLAVRGSAGSWYMYDADLLKPVSRLPIEGPPRWDNLDPDRLFFLENKALAAFIPSLGSTEGSFDFTSSLSALAGSHIPVALNDSPSMDGRFWAMITHSSGGDVRTLWVFNLATMQVIAQKNLPQEAKVTALTVSPLGRSVLVAFSNNCPPNQTGTGSLPCGLVIYDILLREERNIISSAGSFDFAKVESDREGVVFEDPVDRSISMIDLANGKKTRLMDMGQFAGSKESDISGRAVQNPGWALVSTCRSGPEISSFGMEGEIIALELKAGGRAIRVASTHSTCPVQPSVSSNQDLSRVIFTSNWGDPSGSTEVYMVQLYPGWTGQLP